MAITGFRLHSPLSECRLLTNTGSIRTANQMAAVGDTVGVFVEAATATENVAFLYSAPKITLPCVTATTGDYAQGAKVYFDSGEAKLSAASASGEVLCGTVIEAAAVGDTEIMIDLDGRMGITS